MMIDKKKIAIIFDILYSENTNIEKMIYTDRL